MAPLDGAADLSQDHGLCLTFLALSPRLANADDRDEPSIQGGDDFLVRRFVRFTK
jgi:hypothetical protein